MTTNHDLAEQIEHLVRQHIAATRTAAATAVERAFAPVPQGRGTRPSPEPKPQRPRAKTAPRRATEEVVALGERFYAVLCRHPGETMTTLAPQVGATPRALQVAVARLKDAGRVRAVGQRQGMHYFPMAAPTATATAAAA
ncbi:MAG: hypothetical protein ACRETX_06920 [Steroidobacteraceae bacterium]